MQIITKKRVKDFSAHHAGAANAMYAWCKIVAGARWESFDGLRQLFPSADLVDGLVVFNIGGNKVRLIAGIDFKFKRVYVKEIHTHAEYSKRKNKL